MIPLNSCWDIRAHQRHPRLRFEPLITPINADGTKTMRNSTFHLCWKNPRPSAPSAVKIRAAACAAQSDGIGNV